MIAPRVQEREEWFSYVGIRYLLPTPGTKKKRKRNNIVIVYALCYAILVLFLTFLVLLFSLLYFFMLF